MTQTSYPDHADDLAEASTSSGPSSACSLASRASGDASPLSFLSGRKQLVMQTDEGNLFAELPRDINCNANFTQCSDVHVGTKLNINGDVTINASHHIPIPEITEKIECSGNDQTSRSHNKKPFLQKWRYLFIPFLLLFLLLLILISLFVFRESFFKWTPSFPPINPNTTNYIEGHPVYSKDNWGALPQKEPPPLLPTPTSVVIICHTATESCKNFTQCANQTQWVQYKFLKEGHRDIGYNFLIGGDGGIYVGRGWDRQNSFRAKSVTVSFIGDFNKELLGEKEQEAAKDLIREGVRSGMVDENYKLIGENQTSPLRYYSPGWNTVKVIRNWEHFYPGTML